MSVIKVVMADDCSRFRESLIALLATESSIQICAAAIDGAQLLQYAEQYRPDVVLVDLYLPILGAADAVRIIKRLYPSTSALGMICFDDAIKLQEWRAAGADGYLFKTCVSISELVRTLHSVNGGQHCFPEAGAILPQISHLHSLVDTSEDFNEKELEVIRLICQEYTSKQIADLTGLTHRTVETYRRNIMLKIGANNRIGIVAYAFRHGIVIV